MKLKIVLFALFLGLFFSCKKNKFTTRPQLKIKSINNKFIQPGDILRITVQFTDAEGDVSDSAYIQKVTANCPASDYTDRRTIPYFPPSKNLKGEIEISYGYNVTGYVSLGQPQCNRNDTCVFRIWVKDNGGNFSDTAQTESIVIKK